MKTVCKKLFSIMLAVLLLVSAVPFQASADTYVNPVYYTYDQSKTINGGDVTGVLGSITRAPEAPAVPGYAFSHWEALTDEGVGTGIVVSGEYKTVYGNYGFYHTLTTYTKFIARYKTAEYSVTFDGNGGTVSGTNPVKVTHGEYLTTFPTATRADYTFLGWKDANGNWVDGSGAKKAITVNQTLYAQWGTGSYKVTFMEYTGMDANGKNTYQAWRERTVTAQEPYNKNNEVFDFNQSAQKPGYKIIGWIYEDGTTFNPSAPVAKDTKVFPKFEAKTYKVTFKENWAYGTTVTKTVTYDQKISSFYYIPEANKGDVHYTFEGWFFENGGTVDPNVKLDPDKAYTYAYDTTWVADWDAAHNIELWIYKLDKSTNTVSGPYAVVKNFYASNAKPLDLNKVLVTDYVSNVKAGSFSGWFSNYGDMVAHLNNHNQSPITGISNVNSDRELYCYVEIESAGSTNTGTTGGSNNTGSGSSVNTKPADKTNPATGDFTMIEVSTSIMLLTAAALVVMMQLRKRKMI